ncbi:hypothetical protein C3L33_22235, partial [Rhododendron williamsianum]
MSCQGDNWWRSVVVSIYNGVEELGRCGISFWAALIGWKDMGGGVDRDATMVDHLGVLFVWDVAESLRLGGDTVDETIRRTVREVKHGDWKWYDIMILMVEEEMLMRKFYELMSAQSPARKNEEESSTLPGDGRNGQSSALIPACNNEPIGQSSASLIPVCSDEPIGQSSALTPVSEMSKK